MSLYTNKVSFKVGDKVVRTRVYYSITDKFMEKGNTYTVSEVFDDADNQILVEGSDRYYQAEFFKLCEEPAIDLKNCKFRVNSPEHSEQIQKALFANGVKWYEGEARVLYTDKPYLMVCLGSLGYGTNKYYFENEHTQQELTLEVVTPYKFSPVIQEKRETNKETIKIGDKEYDKVEFEAAVANLKAID